MSWPELHLAEMTWRSLNEKFNAIQNVVLSDIPGAVTEGQITFSPWSPNTVLAGPATGTALAVPTKRGIVAADIVSGTLSDALLSTNIMRKVGSYSVTGQTTALGNTSVATGTAAALHILIAHLVVTTAGTGGTIQLGTRVATNRAVIESTASVIDTASGSAAGAATLTFGSVHAIIPFYVQAASVIQVSTTFAGVTGTPAYAIDAAVFQIF